jgi:23S rRNA (adenine2503-C2)-methyltransferase
VGKRDPVADSGAEHGFALLDGLVNLVGPVRNTCTDGEDPAELVQDIALAAGGERSPDLFRGQQIRDRVPGTGETGFDRRPPKGTVAPLSSYSRRPVRRRRETYRDCGPASKKSNHERTGRVTRSEERMPETRTEGRAELLGMTPERARMVLHDRLLEWGQPGYRADQVLSWTWGRRAGSFSEMTDLPSELRERLQSEFRLSSAARSFEARSTDGTIKHLWRLDDGEQVESVLIPADDRVTLCLSSQAGCALGCRFCATGDLGFTRQLRTAEIVEQYRDADRAAVQAFGRAIGNVVYMGMGEPFANLEPVLESLTVLNGGFEFGARRITVSTVGLVPGIRALADRPEPFRLAVSLHSADPQLRRELMPVERRYPLDELLAAVRDYQARKSRRVSFEYAMIDGVNDSVDLARELVSRLAGISSYVNLIPYNPIPGRSWGPSPRDRIAAFLAVLQSGGIRAAVRTPRGRDIAAACGQLRLERELTAGRPPEDQPRPGHASRLRE